MRGKLIGCTVFALLAAAGCSKAPRAESTGLQETTAAPAVAATGAAFDCGGIQLLVSFTGDEVSLDLAEGKLVLPRVEAASGEKYSNGTTTFSVEGETATLERAEGTSECSAQPVRSASPESKDAE